MMLWVIPLDPHTIPSIEDKQEGVKNIQQKTFTKHRPLEHNWAF